MTTAVEATCKRKYSEDDSSTDWVDGVDSDSKDDPDHCKDRWEKALNCSSDETTVKTTGKKKYGEEYRTDWGAVAAMVPGRTKKLCKGGWHNELDSKSDETTAGAGEKWTRDEDSTLTDAVKKHNGEGWAAIATLVSGQTKTQCTSRWHNTLHSKNIETTARKGKWAADEDSTLTDAVKKHNGNDWSAISKLVPGRTKKPWKGRWHNELDSKSDETTARKGKWTAR
jgi:hypothetical protein